MDHPEIELLKIDFAKIASWEARASKLGGFTEAVSIELNDLHSDPTIHRLRRAIKAVRYCTRADDPTIRELALALITDLEAAIASPTFQNMEQGQ